MDLAAIVMAAGKGTRMKSSLPKVLHPILGKPLLACALDTITPLDLRQIAVIVGHEADRVRDSILTRFEALSQRLDFVIQTPQLGTGHAVQVAQPAYTRTDESRRPALDLRW